jgi:hypothetical protein
LRFDIGVNREKALFFWFRAGLLVSPLTGKNSYYCKK